MKVDELKALIESGKDKVINLDGLRVNQLRPGLLNIMESDHTLEQERLDWFRDLLKQAGYREAESWIATQGASWLNSGLFAGVSMRVEKI